MTPNQTIDGAWSIFKRLFGKSKGQPILVHTPSVTLLCGVTWGEGSYGVYLKEDRSIVCGRAGCMRCNGNLPMTPERAAQINQRFLTENGYEN